MNISLNKTKYLLLGLAFMVVSILSVKSLYALSLYDMTPQIPFNKFTIESIDRASDGNNENIILRSYTKNDENIDIMIRDEMGLLEEAISPGMILSLQKEGVDTTSGFLEIEFTDKISFLSQYDKGFHIDRFAHTVQYDQLQVAMATGGTWALISIQENKNDCVTDTKKMCYPGLSFQVYRDGEILEQQVSRGDIIDILSTEKHTVILSDALTNSEYQEDSNIDYAQLEFLVVFNEPEWHPGFININDKAFHRYAMHRFCSASFKKIYDQQSPLEYECTKEGERLIRKNNLNRFKERFLIFFENMFRRR